MNKPEWMLIVIGCIAAIVTGALDPLSMVFDTKIITVIHSELSAVFASKDIKRSLVSIV
jgi:hypothetical protein